MKLRKKDLISLIQNTEPFKNPKIALEQYTIDALSAVDIIYFAGVEFNDIYDKYLVDLGAGTGRLSIASALLTPKCVFSIDIDVEALSILNENTNKIELEVPILPICCDVSFIPLKLRKLSKLFPITTLMNPPFGVQTPKADRAFLKSAMHFSDVIYSIHLSDVKVRDFIRRYIYKLEWKIDYILSLPLILERAFPFHTQKRKEIQVDLYRFLKRNN
ncbi:MAG: Ribosomal protein L11 methyltransferase [Promethearchaeota archaeon]|nr:MAG: Ribosomal protein L11 methyltransferase [Candidatus Lokiarchaeota archaeon]